MHSATYDGFDSSPDSASPPFRSRQGSTVSLQMLQEFSTLEEESALEVRGSYWFRNTLRHGQ